MALRRPGWLTRANVGTAVLLGLLGALLGARHASLFHDKVDFAHFFSVEDGIEQVLSLRPFFPGPNIWDTTIHTAPFFYWLHLPAAFARDPVIGLHIYYALLEAAAIAFWLWWGLRGRIDRHLVWTSAFLLVVYAEPKMIVCENLTAASWLTLAVYITAWRALLTPSPRAMILPGLLLGLTTQLHLTGVFLFGPLAICVALEPEQRWRRLGALTLPFGAVLVLCTGTTAALRALYGMGGGITADDLTLLASFDPANFAARFTQSFRDGLAAAGLLLAVATWIARAGRANPGGPAAGRLAACWLVSTYVLFSAALAYLGAGSSVEPRYTLAIASRAVLSASLLLWLLGHVRRMVRSASRRGLRRWSPVGALIGLAAVGLTVHWFFDARQDRRNFEAEYEQARSAGRPDDFWTMQPWGRSPYSSRFHGLLEQLEADVEDSRDLLFTGMIRHEMAAHVGWARRIAGKPAIHYQRALLGTADATRVLVIPRLTYLDLSGVEGVHEFPWFQAVPGTTEVMIEGFDSPRSIAARIEPRNLHEGLLLLFLEATDLPDRPPRLHLEIDGTQLLPSSHQGIHDRDEARYSGWWVFELPDGIRAATAVVERTDDDAVDAMAAMLPARARLAAFGETPSTPSGVQFSFSTQSRRGAQGRREERGREGKRGEERGREGKRGEDWAGHCCLLPVFSSASPRSSATLR